MADSPAPLRVAAPDWKSTTELPIHVESYPAISETEIAVREDFKHVLFPRGYYLSRKRMPELGAHWKRINIDRNYVLSWDARAPAAVGRLGDLTIALIGRAFHLGLNSFDSGKIVEHLTVARSAGPSAYSRALYDLSGRYVVIAQTSNETTLQTDATGMRSAFYAKTGGVVSSHAALTARLSDQSDPSSFGGPRWFREAQAPYHPGRATEYSGVYMLTPNTELTLESGKVSRVGPHPRGPLRSAEDIAAEVLPLMQRQLSALVEQAPILVSLTAGLDSRITLAASYPVRDHITYFTYSANREDRENPSQGDARFAQLLCGEQGLTHRLVTVDSYLSGGPLSAVMRENSRRVHSPSVAAAYLEQLPQDAIHIRSNVYEIGRSFFRNAASAPLGPLNAKEFARRCVRVRGGHETSDAAISAFEDWLTVTGFMDVEDYDPYDLYYWELRMGRWLPALIYESDIAHDTYTLINSRRILELFLTASDADRLDAEVFHQIMAMSWPSLLKYPVNGELIVNNNR